MLVDCQWSFTLTTMHMTIPSTRPVSVSDERDKRDGSSSVSMRQDQWDQRDRTFSSAANGAGMRRHCIWVWFSRV